MVSNVQAAPFAFARPLPDNSDRGNLNESPMEQAAGINPLLLFISHVGHGSQYSSDQDAIHRMDTNHKVRGRLDGRPSFGLEQAERFVTVRVCSWTGRRMRADLRRIGVTTKSHCRGKPESPPDTTAFGYRGTYLYGLLDIPVPG